jgi:cytochrome c
MARWLTVIVLLFVVGVFYTGMAQQQQKTDKDTTSMMEGKKDSTRKADDKKDTTKMKDPSSPHPQKDPGIGPVKEVTLGPVDQKMAGKGEHLFEQRCSPCHELNKKLVGPPLGKVTQLRSPEFIMNFLLNTSMMEQKDTAIEKLVPEYGMKMPPQDLNKEKARELLEYLRSVAPKESKKK